MNQDQQLPGHKHVKTNMVYTHFRTGGGRESAAGPGSLLYGSA